MDRVRRTDAKTVGPLFCAQCGDVIGMREPIRAILVDGSEHRGTSLTLGAMLEQPGSIAVHERCMPAFRSEQEGG